MLIPTAKRMQNVRRSFVREILKATTNPEIISFAGGLPNPKFIPVDPIAEAVQFTLAAQGAAALQYCTAEGHPLLRQWIESLPGPPVLPPPEISPRGGNFNKPVAVTLKSEPGATIRYTLDGTVPTTSDLLYEKPIQLPGPMILRAKAFKPGCTKSITTQEIFLIGG